MYILPGDLLKTKLVQFFVEFYVDGCHCVWSTRVSCWASFIIWSRVSSTCNGFCLHTVNTGLPLSYHSHPAGVCSMYGYILRYTHPSVPTTHIQLSHCCCVHEYTPQIYTRPCLDMQRPFCVLMSQYRHTTKRPLQIGTKWLSKKNYQAAS